MSAVVHALSTNRHHSRPWQNHELAEFYRVIDILGRAGLGVVPDMGVSDEGEPWFAFCQADSGEVVVHCARIDGVFIATSIAFSDIFRGNQLRDVINSILRSSHFTSLGPVVDKRLYLHPAAVFTAFIAAALLFCKEAGAHEHHSASLGAQFDGAASLAKILASIKPALVHASAAEISSASVANISNGQTTDFDAPISLAALISAAVYADPITDALNEQGLLIAPDVQPLTQHHVYPFMRAPLPLSSFDLPDHHSLTSLQDDSPSAIGSSFFFGLKGVDMSVGVVAALATTESASRTDSPHLSLLSGLESPSEIHFNYTPPPPYTGTSAFVNQVAPTGQQLMTPAGHAFELTDISSVALAMLGIPLPASEATAIVPTSFHTLAATASVASTDSNAASSIPTTLALTESASAPTDETSTITALTLPNPIQDTPDSNSAGSVQSGITATTVAPSTIVIGQNPVPALEQLLDYALGEHSIQASFTVSPLLATALTSYTLNGAQSALLLVFDSTDIKLPVFEFSKGVLFVEDHELGISPAQAAPANLVTVDLANGGIMTLLGIVETSHLMF